MNFKNYLRAGYPLLWCETFEEGRVIEKLGVEAGESYICWEWDIISGLRNEKENKTKEINDPASLIEEIEKISGESIIFLKDSHRFMEDLNFVRSVKNVCEHLKSNDKHIVFLAPVLVIPIELQKDITVIDFKLPGIEELMEKAKGIAEPYKDQLGEVEISEEIISGSKGLTIWEAENAFARSLIEEKKYSKRILEEEKLQQVRKSGLAEIYKSVEIGEIGGLEILKRYMKSRKRGFREKGLPMPKGVLLGGCPGSGKSLFAKATASILEMPLMKVDIGSLKAGIIGESEGNLRKLFSLIKAVSPVVVWFDEFEKSLSGAVSSGKTDGGTTANMVGMLLTFMEESAGVAYFVATCNDMGILLETSQGAFLRRFDDIFFVDLPGEKEREEIYRIMLNRYGKEGDEVMRAIGVEAFKGWTGAEIEKFVRNSHYDGVEVAMRNVKPISVQNEEVLEKARNWAKYNAILANEGDGEEMKWRKIDFVKVKPLIGKN